MKQLILASASPRRKALMAHFEYPFESITPIKDEVLDDTLSIPKQIQKLSYDKAFEIFEKYPDAIVIGADTAISFEHEVLGKPHTKENAIKMLKRLQGNTHTVITAVSIISKEKEHSFISQTSVTFYEMNDEEIENYVNTKEPLDKAGAYTIQEKGARFIKEIQGDYYTVMGLPVSKLYQVLKEDFHLY